MSYKSNRRIESLITLIKKPIDGLLVTNLSNIRYLSNFTGSSAFVILNSNKRSFFTDFRYTTQAKKEVSGFKIEEFKNQNEAIKDFCKKSGIKTLGFEASCTPFAFYKNLKKTLLPVKLSPTLGIIESLRALKDESEIMNIKKSISILGKGLNSILPMLKKKLKEREIALELEYQLKKFGANKLSFDLIVASGKRSALPHGVASNKKISYGELVTLDSGCSYNGYHCDVTRTFIIGKPQKKQQEIYNIVKNAQSIAIENIKPGMTCEEIDGKARDYIKNFGFDKYFGHGLGHGVGLDIHEEPRISKKVKEKIKKGMVFTVEPGIYIPDFGGVRIEDMIYVTESGCRILTKDIPYIFEI